VIIFILPFCRGHCAEALFLDALSGEVIREKTTGR